LGVRPSARSRTRSRTARSPTGGSTRCGPANRPPARPVLVVVDRDSLEPRRGGSPRRHLKRCVTDGAATPDEVVGVEPAHRTPHRQGRRPPRRQPRTRVVVVHPRAAPPAVRHHRPAHRVCICMGGSRPAKHTEQRHRRAGVGAHSRQGHVYIGGARHKTLLDGVAPGPRPSDWCNSRLSA
jgi:hypothetical protein